jgi:predicted transcriptional regulator
MGPVRHERRASGVLEAEVLAVLRGADQPLSPGTVQERLAGDLSYTTVATIVARLYAKGALGRTRQGRGYVYHVVLDEPGLVARRMHQFFDRQRDREAVLARFVGELAPGDEAVLRRLLQDVENADPRRIPAEKDVKDGSREAS